MVKIILCTTFREFRGNDNDKIQYLFIDGIKAQTYQNFMVVTTTFGEKKVKGVLDEAFSEKSVVKEVKLDPQYRFSLTDVMLNAIAEYEKEGGDAIIVWTTCDILYKPNFFHTLVDAYQPGLAGVIHPNILYKTTSDAIKDINRDVHYTGNGIDMIVCDARMLSEKAKGDIIKYRFNDWGVFEYFMMGVMLNYSTQRRNFFPETSLKKIVNDRELTQETKEYFRRCTAMNGPVLKRYKADTHLDRYPEKWDGPFFHFMFKPTKPTFKFRLNELRYYGPLVVKRGVLNILVKIKHSILG